jgi:hypothetical protein
MANRNYNKSVYTLQQDLVMLNVECDIGTTGAVTNVKGSGVSTIARTGVGAYTITLQDNYDRLLGCVVGFTGTTASGVGEVQVNSTAPDTDIKAGTVKIQCFDFAGVAVDPASGVKVKGLITLRNSNVAGKGE